MSFSQKLFQNIFHWRPFWYLWPKLFQNESISKKISLTNISTIFSIFKFACFDFQLKMNQIFFQKILDIFQQKTANSYLSRTVLQNLACSSSFRVMSSSCVTVQKNHTKMYSQVKKRQSQIHGPRWCAWHY